MPKTSVSLKIPKKQGEKAIALAIKFDLLNPSLDIGRDENNLFVPLNKELTADELSLLTKELPNLELIQGSFTEKKQASESLLESLADKLPPHLLDSLPQAFDVIGDIVVIEIPLELKDYEKLIGQAILQTHRNIKTVLAKAGAVSGVFRTREYTVIAGENKTRTIHREYGCQYHVDVAKAYFSPRLSHEHERVASLVQSGETILDLFAGVGPFSVLIGKKNPDVRVYAVDLNPDAVELLKLNVRVNRVENRVFALCADAREISSARLKGAADRVIMNLPETAIDFVDAACNAIKPQGGTVHFYGFVRSPDTIDKLQARFSELVTKYGRNVKAFLYSKSIRETAPYECQVVLDSKVA